MVQPLTLKVPLPVDASPGLYLHIPFCRYVCPYCDFNVYAGQSDLIPEYILGLERELRLLDQSDRPEGGVSTVFIGGGTPSLLEPNQVGFILDCISQTLGIDSDAEITMEGNPDNLNLDYCRDLKAAGISRLSIGVQSLQQPGLKVLGRLHGARGAEAGFQSARRAGFDNVSLDLIYGWPGQTIEQLNDDVNLVLEWNVDHLSMYALIVEQGTPLETAVRRGQLQPVDDDTVALYYDLIVERLDRAGWEHYEISNWARSAEYRSRHNQLYWQNGHYYGIGAGAHSHLGNTRASNVRLPSRYLHAVNAGQSPTANKEFIAPDLAMGESMMLGLRLLEDGVVAADFESRHHKPLQQQYGDLIDRFVDLGLLRFDGKQLRLTERGSLVSNSVLAEFLP